MTVTDVSTRREPRPAMDRSIERVREDGFVHVGRADVLEHQSAADGDDFRSAWDDLPLDRELADGGTYRQRRYGRLRVRVVDGEPAFEALPHVAFRQDVIPLWAGKDRSFAPISEEVLLHTGMRALVGWDALLATALSGVTDWEVGLHLVRVVARPGAEGNPTPEGRHRDGHMYVGMHMLRREGCFGGLSTVHPERGGPVSLTMTDVLEAMFVDDGRVTHEVSPTRAVGDTEGVRDMLLVDLNPADTEAS
ncbi:2OG-Fe dioxygenase family protein [Nocardiopsis sp. FIRDI 009]|uniref:2OG-Fe dioxygenase family protein n=1 Tax=Nocardiopsis sp. FIRDI 009 TaxID=714197 RepID=UPI000E272AE2|nr:2OG-Fe dioxygenase family protein [Nocardiopsis sp. FIRDI 009]